jgi:hypothetical protein
VPPVPDSVVVHALSEKQQSVVTKTAVEVVGMGEVLGA